MRPRSLAVLTGAIVGTAAIVVAARHRHGAEGRAVAGGVLMGNAGRYDTLSRFLLGSFYRSIAADVGSVAPGDAQVLEVGCGPGHLSMLMASKDGLEVTGLDLDPVMIERARANAERMPDGSGRRPTFVVGDVASLPFPGGSFDLVVSTLSMHHWTDATTGLDEISRVLRPGGRALVWDLGPGTVPLHRHAPDPVERASGSRLRVVGATAWRWPWRFSLVQRIELGRADD